MSFPPAIPAPSPPPLHLLQEAVNLLKLVPALQLEPASGHLEISSNLLLILLALLSAGPGLLQLLDPVRLRLYGRAGLEELCLQVLELDIGEAFRVLEGVEGPLQGLQLGLQLVLPAL
jgi:hypothetical protein